MSMKGDIFDELWGADTGAETFCAVAVFLVGVGAFLYLLLA